MKTNKKNIQEQLNALGKGSYKVVLIDSDGANTEPLDLNSELLETLSKLESSNELNVNSYNNKGLNNFIDLFKKEYDSISNTCEREKITQQICLIVSAMNVLSEHIEEKSKLLIQI